MAITESDKLNYLTHEVIKEMSAELSQLEADLDVHLRSISNHKHASFTQFPELS
jgi:enoyl-CoA hydratase/carnithine racemase